MRTGYAQEILLIGFSAQRQECFKSVIVSFFSRHYVLLNQIAFGSRFFFFFPDFYFSYLCVCRVSLPRRNVTL